ncbi:hypothetical protein NKR23_g911 [Pleurostoma richardsiae]|uniref:SAM domain-containing protein n=1 Tax=Pleurostoma richardsiae TaxID=41990 RepID=A0AA38S5G8_9PEZI|nr:hypothetical protein NKR23_g911 [Pleurostoma richardsiae]
MKSGGSTARCLCMSSTPPASWLSSGTLSAFPSAPATQPPPVPIGTSATRTPDTSSSGNGFGNELQCIKQWFAALGDAERAAAFAYLAELPTRREIGPLIQRLQDRERRMILRKQERLEQQGDASKPALPPFPRDCKDPAWLSRWLRTLRLHKYEQCLSGLRPPDLINLEDEDFKRLGVDTVGARNKLLHVLSVARRELEAEDEREQNGPQLR